MVYTCVQFIKQNILACCAKVKMSCFYQFQNVRFYGVAPVSVAKPEIQPRMARPWSALNTFVVMPNYIHGIIVGATPVVALFHCPVLRNILGGSRTAPTRNMIILAGADLRIRPVLVFVHHIPSGQTDRFAPTRNRMD